MPSTWSTAPVEIGMHGIIETDFEVATVRDVVAKARIEARIRTATQYQTETEEPSR
jgi:hypothetical protein